MDAQTRLAQWTSSVFPADLPDFNWSRLELAGTIPNEQRLILRLAAGAIVLAVGILVPAGFVLSAMCILSVIITGYDYVLAGVHSVLRHKPFTTSVFITLALIFSLIAGNLIDAAAFMILYRAVTILYGYVTERTISALRDALGESPKFQTQYEAPVWLKWIAPVGLILALAVFIFQLWVAEAPTSIAVRNALSVLIIANPYAITASAALTWLCAMSGAYRFRILFRSTAAMRKLLNVRAVVLDDAGREEDALPKIVSVKSDRLSPDMLLRLAAYAEYYSTSRTAKAILAAFHESVDTTLIERTLDIPRCGVEAYISGLHLFVGTRELMLLHAITIPDEDLTNGYAVYIAVQGTYAGRLMLQEVSSIETMHAVEDFRSLGVRSVTLFSPAQNESVTSVARDLRAQLFCKLTDVEKDATLLKMQKAMPRTESLLYIERDCEARPRRSPADVHACMIRSNNQERFDADFLVVDGDLQKIVESVETAQWVSGLRKLHLTFTAAVKVLLVALAFCGASTMWFAAVLDGAAALFTMLISARAYEFDKTHRRLQDFLKPYQTN